LWFSEYGRFSIFFFLRANKTSAQKRPFSTRAIIWINTKNARSNSWMSLPRHSFIWF